MSREAETRGASLTAGLRPAPLLLTIASFLLLATLLMTIGSADAAGAHLTFETPQADTYVHESVDVMVNASTNVTNVTFYYRSTGDYVLIGQGTLAAPSHFNVSWDTRWVGDGDYELMANGTLDMGGYETVNVTDIHVDNTKPSLSFLRPSFGDRVNGIYMITLGAGEDVVSVDLYIDFVPLGAAIHVTGTSNWTYPWDTTGYNEAEGLGFLAAALDSAGNEKRTTVSDIAVDNVPPVVSMVAPEDNATLDGYVRLLGNTSEMHILQVHFQWRVDDGIWLDAGPASWNETLELYTYLWNTYDVGEFQDVEVSFTVMDDLGQTGVAVARNITIIDLPPTPTITCPGAGAHLTGTVALSATAPNDTRSLTFEYHDGDRYVMLGDAVETGDGVWNHTWVTDGLSIFRTSIRATAKDNSGSAEAIVANVEVDNTSPDPRILDPAESDYHLTEEVTFSIISDPDTVNLSLHMLNGTTWELIGDAEYDQNLGRWVLYWEIPETLYIADSAICATAVDEVGLTGSSPPLANREIGNDPEDRPPRFERSMPEVIYFNEDHEYILYLGEHVWDDSPSTLKAYVSNEPESLFSVYGENTVGNVDLRFIPVPNKHGEAHVDIYIVDSGGQWAMQGVKVFIRSVPDPPYFTSVPPNLYLHPGVPYTFDYGPYINDVDTYHDDLSILKPDDQRVVVQPGEDLILVFTSDDKVGTIFTVEITVMDGNQLTTNRSILVTLTDDWVPELRKPLPDIELEEDEKRSPAFNLDDYFHDPDHDALFYSYGNQYVSVVIGNEYPHPVSIYTPQDWHGTDTITFRANDPTGALLEDTIMVICRSKNDPPTVRVTPGFPDLVIHTNESYDFDLSPYIEDVDHELADLVITTGDIYATRSEKFPLGLRLTYQVPRSFDIFIIVTDPEGGECNATIRVEVGDNFPPRMDKPPDVVMDEGSVAYSVFNVSNAFDPDWYTGGAVGSWKDLTYEFVCDHAIFTIHPNTGWVDVSLPDPDFNTYNGTHLSPLTVLVRVIDDGGALAEHTFKLTILAVNDAPEVSQIQDLVIIDGITHIDLRNYIRDVDTPFSSFEFEVEDANDPGATISQIDVYGTLLVLDYRGSPARKDTVNLWIIDSENRVMIEFDVEVKVPVEDTGGISIWVIVLVAVTTGGIAIYASKLVWGRFEPPSVQDVFLVYGDGIIIRHLSKRGAIGMDEDLAIAMLTAIQEFVQQSMRSAQLKSMQAGEHNILIERDPGKLFYIAVIHTGTVSEELRKAINSATRGIKENYGHVLKKWDGNIAKFDGVEKNLQEILVITHAHIPEGVRFEMEGITSIEPGKTFLFHGKDVTRTHNIFRDLVIEQGSGLLISRVHPQRLHPSVAEAGAECVWLSKTPTKRGVSPSNTTMILHEITTYVRDHKRTVVCLDGLEYLLVQNPLDEVVAFVEELQDMVQMDDFIMMVHVDPYALDEVTLAKLSRNMVPVSDQNGNNNGNR